MDLYKISIPNLYDNPYIIVQVILNNKTYYFEYFWNVRHSKVYLSIYLLDNNIQTYILRNICLTNGIHISKNIKYDDWIGDLFLVSYKLDLNDYSPQNISSNFYLLYRVGELEIT